MSLPPGFLEELRTRSSLSQVVGRKVMWDARKSNQGKGDMWAPCPFHQEKSASFHVDDRKGFYYCFGCHAKGDAISFVRETENVSFMEAVEILAREAGMTMPERDPRAQEKADRRTVLMTVMEQAVQFFRLQLRTNQGAAAREYLEKRGLSQDAQDRWEIGYAPDARQSMLQHLRDKGIDDQLIIDAGLCARPDDGGAPYDRFRGRIIFPIRDHRGFAIAFGGRAMDPNARAKYLNSPETILFDKGRSLFNVKAAREAAGKGQPLIVAEGYMDVIALSEAGFGACVAPLGTAITENQLQMLWRISPEPVITMDGDTAGQRAAMRLVDLALPVLEAGKSLRFSVMPEGQDPDDLLKAQGPGAMQHLIDTAKPMVSLLWQREVEGKVFDSPERKAALDKSFADAVAKIADENIRYHYSKELRDRRWDLFRPVRKAFENNIFRMGAAKNVSASTGTKDSKLATKNAPAFAILIREAFVFSVALKRPDLVVKHMAQLERRDCNDVFHRHLKDAILRYAADFIDDPEAFSNEISNAVNPEPLEPQTAYPQVLMAIRLVEKNESHDLAAAFEQELAKLLAQQGHELELAEAREDVLVDTIGEGLTWRLGQATEEVNRAARGDTEDSTEYYRADNGLELSKDELKERDALFANIRFEGPQKRN
ncbi:DNA primase [Halocynthiibacter namhaensis]|uniref:DNA primase n=1 Tax=Halocynthiibacter namhaensis TaxID=1290553 RepID=UPI000578E4E0|nr:DNA primase [Halocynthiibacter namhaensis]